MAKVRARKDNGQLFLDFYYRGVRCREQTTLPDTAENRRKVQGLLNRIEKEIKHGSFDYAATFPASPRASKFSTGEALVQSTSAGAHNGVSVRPPLPSFMDYSVTWRALMAPQWRRQHQQGVGEIFKKHLLPAFGTQPLNEIAKADVLTFRAKLAELPGRAGKTLSAARINKIMTIFRQIMVDAQEQYSLENCFSGIKRLKARKTDVQPFSLDEVERICATIREDYRNYATVRFLTGMRTGEINGLKWKYLDLERNLILVRETYSAGECEENAKTEQSLRDIPMLPEVRRAIEDQLTTRDPGSPYVFTTRGGGPVDANNFANRIWYPLLRYLDIEKRRPYQTRHTAATLMLAAGENPEWIARVMGHANTQMLFTVYSRYVPNLTRQDGLAMTGMLNTRRTSDRPAKESVTSAQLNAMSPDQLRQALSQLLASTPDNP